MAGHSHAHNIMFKKGVNDAKKAKIFTKIARDIQVAAKSGSTDPELNSKLKILISKARSLNMPNDKIASAIEKAIKIQQITKMYVIMYFLIMEFL